MSLIVRVILIASMLLQSLPGLAMQRCVAMPDASALAAAGMPADANCGCCGNGADGETIECPMAKNGYVGCNCKNPQSQEPKSPPSDQKPRQIEHLFLAMPFVVALLPREPLPSPRWTAIEPLKRSGSHSIQSLLCVWLM